MRTLSTLFYIPSICTILRCKSLFGHHKASYMLAVKINSEAFTTQPLEYPTRNEKARGRFDKTKQILIQKILDEIARTKPPLLIDTLVPSLRSLNCFLPPLPPLLSFSFRHPRLELGISTGINLSKSIGLADIPSEQPHS